MVLKRSGPCVLELGRPGFVPGGVLSTEGSDLVSRSAVEAAAAGGICYG